MQYLQTLIEQTVSLNIYYTKKAVIYSVFVPFLQGGDILTITSAFEATNPYHYNVMIGSCIILADSERSAEGEAIDIPNAFNISPDMHHGVVNRSRIWKAASDYENKYVNVVGWAASENAKASHQLKIEQSYGHLDILIAKETI